MQVSHVPGPNIRDHDDGVRPQVQAILSNGVIPLLELIKHDAVALVSMVETNHVEMEVDLDIGAKIQLSMADMIKESVFGQCSEENTASSTANSIKMLFVGLRNEIWEPGSDFSDCGVITNYTIGASGVVFDLLET